jgi:hypothetical protein
LVNVYLTLQHAGEPLHTIAVATPIYHAAIFEEPETLDAVFAGTRQGGVCPVTHECSLEAAGHTWRGRR